MTADYDERLRRESNGSQGCDRSGRATRGGEGRCLSTPWQADRAGGRRPCRRVADGFDGERPTDHHDERHRLLGRYYWEHWTVVAEWHGGQRHRQLGGGLQRHLRRRRHLHLRQAECYEFGDARQHHHRHRRVHQLQRHEHGQCHELRWRREDVRLRRRERGQLRRNHISRCERHHQDRGWHHDVSWK